MVYHLVHLPNLKILRHVRKIARTFGKDEIGLRWHICHRTYDTATRITVLYGLHPFVYALFFSVIRFSVCSSLLFLRQFTVRVCVCVRPNFHVVGDVPREPFLHGSASKCVPTLSLTVFTHRKFVADFSSSEVQF